MSDDVAHSHDYDGMLARLRDGRKPKPPPSQEDLERAARDVARTDAEMEQFRPRVHVTDFIAAKRAEVDKLEALARELMEAHPAPEAAPEPGSIDDQVEAEWRELAHASQQLRPLLVALERANASEPGFEKYKDGFDFRLTEAMTTVAKLCAHRRVDMIRQKKAARKERPRAESPILRFIRDYLKRRPNAKTDEVKTKLLNAADDVQEEAFDLSDDKSEIISPEDHEPDKGPRFHLRVSGIPQAVARERGNLRK